MAEDFGTPQRHRPVSLLLSPPQTEAPPCWNALVALLELAAPLEQRLETFELRDRRAFLRWFEREFAQVLARYRLLRREQRAVHRQLASLADGLLGTAFGETKEDAPALTGARALEEFGDALRRAAPEEDPDDAFADPGALAAAGFADTLTRLRTGLMPYPRREPPGPDRLRRVYRLLARALHPDAHCGGRWTHDALWLEAQTAYQNRNLGRLETLWAIVQASAGGSDADVDPDGVFLAAIETENRLRELGEKVRLAAQSPAFDFTRRAEGSDLAALRRTVYGRARAILKEHELELRALRKQFSRARWQLRGERQRQAKKEQLTLFLEIA